jgi:hypothetical protein
METNTNFKDRKVDGQYYPKINRSRRSPRYQIRRLLRSFAPLEHPPNNRFRSCDIDHPTS